MRAFVMLVGRNLDLLMRCNQVLREAGFVVRASTDVNRAASVAIAGDFTAVVEIIEHAKLQR